MPWVIEEGIMNIVVPVRLVPDLVEELEIDEGGAALDTTFMRLMLNEPDEHAIEQAILLKERSDSQVTVIIPDGESADDVLYAAAAKGADRLVKITGDLEAQSTCHAQAYLFKTVIGAMQPDLILAGVQAHNDLDGSLGPILAEYLGIPYIGYVAGVRVTDGTCTASKEFPGGLQAEYEVALPAVLGIQAAEEPPRYVAISKIRQIMKTATIDESPAGEAHLEGAPSVNRMFQPEGGERAEMIEGDEDAVAARIVAIFQEQGVL
jgi:electron transfer flavoprotein beta subunit